MLPGPALAGLRAGELDLGLPRPFGRRPGLLLGLDRLAVLAQRVSLLGLVGRSGRLLRVTLGLALPLSLGLPLSLPLSLPLPLGLDLALARPLRHHRGAVLARPRCAT